MQKSSIPAVALKTRKRGFTLIELLVVIAIIAILAAILFPVFARARENARRASCQSNLKNIGMAVLQYTQDANEFYMPEQNSDNKTFVTILDPFLKSRKIFVCPSAPKEQVVVDDSSEIKDGTWQAFGDSGNYGLYTDFAMSPSKALASLPKPAEAQMIFDSSWYETLDLSGDGGAVQESKRHFDGVNICFADGHVKWLSADAVADLDPDVFDE